MNLNSAFPELHTFFSFFGDVQLHLRSWKLKDVFLSFFMY